MATKKLIKCGKLFNGVDEKLFNDQEILVSCNTIEQVGEKIQIDEKTEIIDLSDMIVTPGLMEIHSHFISIDENMYSAFKERISYSDTYRMFALAKNLCRMMENGFTLVRECCSFEAGWEMVSIRNAIRAGLIKGPDFVVSCHSGGSPGSHVDVRQLIGNTDAFPLYHIPSIGTGPEFFKEWVRTEFMHDSDFIKFHIDGGFATPHDDPSNRYLTDEEIKAIIETAHACRKKATAHIYFDESAKIAIKHGIDGIEHGCLLSGETIREMEEKGVYLVPTMKFVERGVYLEDLDQVPDYMAEKYKFYHDTLVKTREVLIDRLVNGDLLVGYGADLGAIDPTSSTYLEFETMVRAGIPPLKALKCATSNSAKIVERDDLGAIEKGKQADIVAWDKNPVVDSKALRECAFVMKSGKVFKKNGKVYQ